MRRTLSLSILLAVVAGCASKAEPGARSSQSPRTGSGAASEEQEDEDSSLISGGGQGTDNPSNGLPEIPPPEPDASTDPFNASPCEVGKFCGPLGPDPDNCGTLRLEQDVEITRHPGNLLIVFDQSASMAEPWGNGTKLAAAQLALQNSIMSLQDSLTVGAIFFPTYACVPALPPPPGGAVTPIEGEGNIPFMPGPDFLNAWSAKWNNLSISLGIGTPMNEAFDRADVALQTAQLTGDVAVVAFTDGAPNCLPDPELTMTPTALETDWAARWLADRNVKTYVVGLPGAAGVEILNNVAVSGGTMEYILPDDPAALEAKLREVVSETIKAGFDSCSINLTPAADPVDKLQMVVEENGVRQQVARMLSADAGWTISADGTHVEITGALCEDAKAGRFESITFEYGCKELPPLPPPMGPM